MTNVSEHTSHRMGLGARCSLAVHSLNACSLVSLPGFQLFFAETCRPIASAHHVKIKVLIGQKWRVCNFFLNVTFLFAILACARGARGTPWRRRAPTWVCFLHLLPMRALPRTGLNLCTVSRCRFLVAPG